MRLRVVQHQPYIDYPFTRETADRDALHRHRAQLLLDVRAGLLPWSAVFHGVFFRLLKSQVDAEFERARQVREFYNPTSGDLLSFDKWYLQDPELGKPLADAAFDSPEAALKFAYETLQPSLDLPRDHPEYAQWARVYAPEGIAHVQWQDGQWSRQWDEENLWCIAAKGEDLFAFLASTDDDFRGFVATVQIDPTKFDDGGT